MSEAKDVVELSTSDRLDEQKQRKDGPLSSAIESLIAQVDSGRKGPATFGVLVGTKMLFFRRPKSSDELEAFNSAGFKFIQTIRNPKASKSKEIKAALEEVGEVGDRDLIHAFTLSFFSVEPEKITQAQALRLTPNVVALDNIIAAINREHCYGMQVMNLGAVMLEKKDSTTTSRTNANSGRASRTSKNSRKT